MALRYILLATLLLAACGDSANPGASSDGNGPTVGAGTAPGDVDPAPLPDLASDVDTDPPIGGVAENGAVQTPSTVGSAPTMPPGEPTAQAPSPTDAPTAPSASAGTSADDILERAERAYAGVRSMEAEFTQQVYVPLLDRTLASRGRIYHRAPDRFAMRFTEPQGDVIVADGTYIWMYHPSTDPRQVMRSRLTQAGQPLDLQREFLSNATDRYNATRTGSEPVAGRSAHALTLIPRGPSPYRSIRIWVDAQDFLVRRFEIEEENESVRRLEMTNLRPGATIPDAIFEFTPPQGVQIYEP